jgi:DNA-binding response OmpR family regulator
MEPSNKLFIVVIDDSKTVCQILEGVLTKEGHQVQSFQNPVPALRSVLKTGETPRPDLLFIDLALPNIDGFEVIRRFKSNPVSHHIPIVVISRRGDPVTRLKARLGGAADYLEKPFQPQDVLTIVQPHIRSTKPTISENE